LATERHLIPLNALLALAELKQEPALVQVLGQLTMEPELRTVAQSCLAQSQAPYGVMVAGVCCVFALLAPI
jgi:hypothetical protein